MSRSTVFWPDPAIASVVHYSEHGKCRAAIITEVHGHAVTVPDLKEAPEWVVDLFILYSHSLRFVIKVVQMEGATSHDHGTWHWPEPARDKVGRVSPAQMPSYGDGRPHNRAPVRGQGIPPGPVRDPGLPPEHQRASGMAGS